MIVPSKAALIRVAGSALGIFLLGLGLAYSGLGTGGFPASHADDPPATPHAPERAHDRPGPSANPQASVHAEAWNALRDRGLPRSERIAIQKALLRRWAESDLEAALVALFAETEASELLPACDEAMRAGPLQAWELTGAKSLDWERARLRRHLLHLFGRNDPVVLFGILDRLTPGERADAAGSAMRFAVERLAGDWPDVPALREAELYQRILALEVRPDGTDLLRTAGCDLSAYLSVEDLAALVENPRSTAERKLLLAAHAASRLSQLDVGEVCPPRSGSLDGEPSRSLDLGCFPPELRAEMAAIALRMGYADSDFILDFAEVAAEAGDLDSLKAASDIHAFVHQSQSMRRPSQWADWALALPEDPRTLDTFAQVMLGAAYGDPEGPAARSGRWQPVRGATGATPRSSSRAGPTANRRRRPPPCCGESTMPNCVPRSRASTAAERIARRCRASRVSQGTPSKQTSL